MSTRTGKQVVGNDVEALFVIVMILHTVQSVFSLEVYGQLAGVFFVEYLAGVGCWSGCQLAAYR